MQIALDYDDTFTRDPIGWAGFVKLMIGRGHSVMIVTWRTPEEIKESSFVADVANLPLSGIFATSRVAKEKFMVAQGINIHCWVDDNPRSIIHTMEGY